MTRLDIRHLVKWYLDKRGVVENRFHDNFPSNSLAKHFIESQPKLSEHVAEYIKKAQADVNKEIMTEYFSNL